MTLFLFLISSHSTRRGSWAKKSHVDLNAFGLIPVCHSMSHDYYVFLLGKWLAHKACCASCDDLTTACKFKNSASSIYLHTYIQTTFDEWGGLRSSDYSLIAGIFKLREEWYCTVYGRYSEARDPTHNHIIWSEWCMLLTWVFTWQECPVQILYCVSLQPYLWCFCH